MKKILLIVTMVTGLFASELSIKSEDGYILHGVLDFPKQVKPKYPIVLFAHQFGADHTIWNDLVKKFNERGFATLNVDLRGHGKSISQNGKDNKVITDSRLDHIKEALLQSDKKVGFRSIPSDLSAWLETISENKKIDMDNLYLVGSSLGGGAVISLLGDYEAKALIAISAGKSESMRDDIDMALASSMTKSLFIAAKNDPMGAYEQTLQYSKKGILSTSLIISGDGHGAVLLPKVEQYIFVFIENIK